jgi:serine protease AprX
VIAVAGAELASGGWKVPSWATSGDGTRSPDVAAPGTSIVSLRAPGSTVDVDNPSGYVSEDLFKGTGSSQSAAVVSGAAALLLSARPGLTPDQVKALINGSAHATAIKPRDVRKSGNGLLRVGVANSTAAPAATQTWPAADGTGSLEASRGGRHVTVLGAPWEGARWMGARWMDGSWDGARWMDGTWMGARWMGSSWAGARWMGARWMGARWMGSSWAGARWMGDSWTGAQWLEDNWSGARWMGSWD